MITYRITSKAGVEAGTYEGESALHALAAAHREAGHPVEVVDGALHFSSATEEEQCGGLDDWYIQALHG